jgi:uncharacterized protein (UPF0303 family)
MSLASDIATLIRQEERLRFAGFDEGTAWDLGQRMRTAAVTRRLPLVIDIRHKGRPLFYTALAGTDADNPEWVRRKANTVLRFHRSSYRFGRELLAKVGSLRPDPDRALADADYAFHGGGFPIHVTGTGVIGAVTVSGIPQRDDHGFVVEMICEYLGLPPRELMLGAEET